MAKISIGLRGWRFDEEAVFTEDGNWRPFDEMPTDEKNRLLRLQTLVNEPCDACYLIHGEAEKAQCNVAEYVYGEPGGEVLLCDDHEPDFMYWYRESGGSDYRGETELRDAFHEWFVAGNRAPEDYEGMEYVDTAPADLPAPPDPSDVSVEVEVEQRIDILAEAGVDRDGEPLEEDDLDDVDLSQDYPS